MKKNKHVQSTWDYCPDGFERWPSVKISDIDPKETVQAFSEILEESMGKLTEEIFNEISKKEKKQSQN